MPAMFECPSTRSSAHTTPPTTRRTLIKQYAAEAAPCRTPAKFAKPPADSGCQLAQFRLHSEADSAWAAGWEQFHEQHAQLEALCKHCASRHAEASRQQQQRRSWPSSGRHAPGSV